jgi:tetratricopeptide (TPR) repeat protein
VDAPDSTPADIGESYWRLGMVYGGLGEAAQSIAMFEQAERLYEGLDGPDHPRMSHLYGNFGFWLHRLGESERGEYYYRRALEIDRRVFNPEHTYVGITTSNLADLVNDDGDFEYGRRLAEQGLKILVATQPADSWRIQNARSVLGESLATLNRFEEAETLLLESYERLQQSQTVGPVYIKDALKRLVRLYTLWSRPIDAELYQYKLKRLAPEPG